MEEVSSGYFKAIFEVCHGLVLNVDNQGLLLCFLIVVLRLHPLLATHRTVRNLVETYLFDFLNLFMSWTQKITDTISALFTCTFWFLLYRNTDLIPRK